MRAGVVLPGVVAVPSYEPPGAAAPLAADPGALGTRRRTDGAPSHSRRRPSNRAAVVTEHLPSTLVCVQGVTAI